MVWWWKERRIWSVSYLILLSFSFSQAFVFVEVLIVREFYRHKTMERPIGPENFWSLVQP
jgi:hypothetical protein